MGEYSAGNYESFIKSITTATEAVGYTGSVIPEPFQAQSYAMRYAKGLGIDPSAIGIPKKGGTAFSWAATVYDRVQGGHLRLECYVDERAIRALFASRRLMQLEEIDRLAWPKDSNTAPLPLRIVPAERDFDIADCYNFWQFAESDGNGGIRRALYGRTLRGIELYSSDIDLEAYAKAAATIEILGRFALSSHDSRHHVEDEIRTLRLLDQNY